MKEKLEKLKQYDWQKLVSRPSALLFSSICAEAFPVFKKVTGIPWRVKNRLVLSDGQLFHTKEDLEVLKKRFDQGGLELLDSFLRQLIWHVIAFDRFTRHLSKNNYEKMTDKELRDCLSDFEEYAKNAHNFITPLPLADEVLTNIFIGSFPQANKEEKRSWWRTLTFPSKENELTREARDFYELARAYKNKSRRYRELLESHLKKYAWIGARSYHWNRVWTSEIIEKRLLNFFVEDKTPERKLIELKKAREQAMSARRKIMLRLKVNSNKKLKSLIELAQEYAYRRTWRTDIIYRSGYHAKELFYEISRRVGLDRNFVPYLTLGETRQIASDLSLPVNKRELSKRKRFYAYALLDGEHTILAGSRWQSQIRPIIKENDNFISYLGLKGQPTCPGKVIGRVKIVNHPDDLKKIKRGDILVATMTFPHFISGMEKAAAFITDEGGVLSHAAIVSREMGKPCVTGTHIATKALKDGDIVEVNATKGIIKIIKK
jgi:phosphohistidine swiveling domain-containing protein